MARILIVDDEPDLLDFLSDVFAKRGYKVDIALSGEDGIEKTKSNPPDIMLLDILLPGMDGIQILRKVKEIDPNIAIIIMTAIENELAKKALNLGADGYVTKPIDFGKLERTFLKLTNLKCSHSAK